MRLTEQLKEIVTQTKETNSILMDFMGLSAKHWERQQTFNGIFINELKNTNEALPILTQLDTRVTVLEERQNQFETRLTNIEKLLRAS